MTFRILGLDPAPFQPLFGLSDEALAAKGVRRMTVDAKPGFPDRIEIKDAELGQTVLLLNHTHQPADTPYRASHAIFVREGAQQSCSIVGEIPHALRLRTLSLRAFDEEGEMLDADLPRARCWSRSLSGCWPIPRSPISTPTTPSAAATPPASSGPS